MMRGKSFRLVMAVGVPTVLAGLLAMPGTAQAARVIEDPFAVGGNDAAGQYVANETISGKSPATTGFNTDVAWITDTVAASVDYRVLPTANLTYTRNARQLVTSGGALELYRTGTNPAQPKRARRDTALTGSTPGTIYVSTLIRFNAAAADAANAVPFYAGTVSHIADPADQAAKAPLGFGFAPATGGGFNAAIFNIGGTIADDVNIGTAGTTAAVGAATYAADTTHLLVAKVVDVGITDEITLYVNPSDLTNIAGSAAETISATKDAYVGNNAAWGLRAYLFGNPSGGDSILFDEFRVSNTSLEDAAVSVPEPASLGLLGIAAAGLLQRRRQSK